MTDQEMNTMTQEAILTTGEPAPAGKYFCDKCGFELDHKGEVLPNCPQEAIWTVWDTSKTVIRT
ncbi:MAG: hypothetical protein CVU59_13270 [Deltaproteobacteria bacterium HGW-Deltaproteobacteria-17]|nr:MAG: hypothetical protein CVU59_13270 [Deltaproteobacteria bacterium HGW-Deltaproteobacteria-17]